jgi:hypothetical protein
MKGIQIVASNEQQFLKAAKKLGLTVIKLPKIRIPGFVFYRVEAPYSQMDLFTLGVAYTKLVGRYKPGKV